MCYLNLFPGLKIKFIWNLNRNRLGNSIFFSSKTSWDVGLTDSIVKISLIRRQTHTWYHLFWNRINFGSHIWIIFFTLSLISQISNSILSDDTSPFLARKMYLIDVAMRNYTQKINAEIMYPSFRFMPIIYCLLPPLMWSVMLIR